MPRKRRRLAEAKPGKTGKRKDWIPVVPKEHGGWAMLLMPYVIGLGVAAGFTLQSVLFLVCIVFVFMASEPLGMVIKGGRAKNKAVRSKGVMAFRWLVIYLALAALFASPLLLLYQQWWLIFFGALGAGFLGVQGIIESRRLDRTVLGELVGAFGLSLSAPGAYYVTVGHLGATAFFLWLLTAFHSAGSVFYINMRLRHHLAKVKSISLTGLNDRLRFAGLTAVYLVVLVAVLTGLILLGAVPLLSLVAFLPLVCKVVKAIYEAKPDLTFKRLGLLELANAIVFAALMVLSYVLT